LPTDLDDLLPLFLEEAGARLDRLGGLLPEAIEDPDAAVQVRRELHALKGAGRLMGLSDIADLCHQAEDCLLTEGHEGIEGASAFVEQVRGIVEKHRGRTRRPPGASRRQGGLKDSPKETAIRGGSGELRVAAEIIDGLAERSARMRVVSRNVVGPVQRLFELATIAERSHAEGAVDELADLGATLRSAALEIENTSKTLNLLGEEQLDAALKLQVRPLRPFLRTLARHTRELARSLGKEVRVSTSGGDVQLDRRILEAIREASLHLVHNAVDHGIEDREEREALGKGPQGRIHLSAETDGGRVKMMVSDDGRGIDPDEVVRLAVERGLVNPSAAAQLTAAESYQLLELPGFTTRTMATDVSGRGIGLDAVAALFRSIGGDLWIRSTPGEGSRVTVEVPVARRGERVLVVQVGKLVLALPSAAVRSFSRLQASDLLTEDGRTIVRQGDSTMPAVLLAALFSEPEADHATMVETTISGRSTAIIVDSILGDEEIFIRPLPAMAGAPPSIQGIAVLSTGNPVAVLSLQRLGPLEIGDQVMPEATREYGTGGRILLTDDTAATRKMLIRLLEDAGYRVMGVESAEEALRLIENEPFDCVITGVELPGLSGIDLTRRVRSSDLYSDLPVVVLSTRDRPADRLEGLEAGADAYLPKQGMDPARLLSLIRRITSDAAEPL